MFDKILYPTDFSDVARKALAYIVHLKTAERRKWLSFTRDRQQEFSTRLPAICLWISPDSRRPGRKRRPTK